MENFLNEDEFDLHKNERAGKHIFRTKTRFDVEAKHNAEMVSVTCYKCHLSNDGKEVDEGESRLSFYPAEQAVYFC